MLSAQVWGDCRVLPSIASVVAFFNQIWANKANFHNFMVKINTFLGGVGLFLPSGGLSTAIQHWQNPVRMSEQN
jgi:hypothetical protein